jgi:hypothetical protein
VLFVGMLSGTYSSICIATPVLADLKERESQYKLLAKRVTLRASGGRAALRARAKAERAGVAGRGADNGPDAAGLEPPDDAADRGPDDAMGGLGPEAAGRPDAGYDDAAAETGEAGPDERVPAGRAASGGSTLPRSTSGSRPGPRQQPRRSSAAKRRPTGKKKRR